jgi:hypothetical protein
VDDFLRGHLDLLSAWQSTVVRTMDDIGVWEALIGGPGIEHAHATVNGTPEAAVEVAMARAEQKYGAPEWGRWRFRAEWCSEPVVLWTVYFCWSDHGLVQSCFNRQVAGACLAIQE